MLGRLAAATICVLATFTASAQTPVQQSVKIGNVQAYSGPASAFGIIGRVEAAYFRMINDQGGIGGTRVDFISYDDGYSPPKAIEQTRKLVESDDVLLVFNALGTASNSAAQRYLNSKAVPQLFVGSPADRWNDPAHFPWTMGFQPSARAVARILAKYVLANKSDAKVAILFQNDDFGKDYLTGIRDVFGDKSSDLIVAQEGYEVTDPTMDSQIVRLKSSGANVVIYAALPKFAAQAIKKTAELGWKPLQLLSDVSISIGSVIAPAGFENAQGIVSAGYLKDLSDSQWSGDEGVQRIKSFLAKYMPEANYADTNVSYGYAAAQTMQEVLRKAGGDFSRTNIMKQASTLSGFTSDALLPGITVNTTPTDFAPIKQMRMMRFEGSKWNLFGANVNAEIEKNR